MRPISMKTALIIVCLLITASSLRAESPWQIDWVREIGTSEFEQGTAIAAAPDGSVYLSGETLGDLAAPNAGEIDAFLAKYDASGNALWTRQYGTLQSDETNDMALDAAGNVYVSGHAFKTYPASVAKYDSAGNPIGDRIPVYGYDFTIDQTGSFYVAQGSEVAASKYASDGSLIWTCSQPGSVANDGTNGVALSGTGNVFFAGATQGDIDGTNAGSFDAFVGMCDASGELQWIDRFGTSELDSIRAVAADTMGNVFVGGNTEGSLGGDNAGYFDPFLAKYDSAGQQLWVRQFGTGGLVEAVNAITVDDLGNAFVTGTVDGQAFLSQYDPFGNLVWTQALYTFSYSDPYSSFSSGGESVVLGPDGAVYVGGWVVRNYGVGLFDYDAYLMKVTVPEPGCLALLFVGGLTLLKRRRETSA